MSVAYITMKRTIFEDEHELFRESVRGFVASEVQPRFIDWEDTGIVDRALFMAAGSHGFLGTAAPEQHGGGGVADFRFNQILAEEMLAIGATGASASLTLHNDVCLPYFLELADEPQQARWLPGIVSGELITAIAMSEPTTGSDLGAIRTTAIRDGDVYILNGAKTFITNGINSDLVIVAAKTDPAAGHKGMSLLVVERGMPGFERGRKLEKLGLHSQDTAELFFTDVRVPVENRLGPEGRGFGALMRNLPQERMSIATSAVASARAALAWTIDYCKERTAFGQPIGSFQNSRFKLAEMRADVEIATQFVDQCVLALNAGTLTADDAAIAKWRCTEIQDGVIDAGLQLHGGYGYMLEYPIARAYADARVTRIYGGTTEIMKEIVGRAMGF